MCYYLSFEASILNLEIQDICDYKNIRTLKKTVTSFKTVQSTKAKQFKCHDTFRHYQAAATDKTSWFPQARAQRVQFVTFPVISPASMDQTQQTSTLLYGSVPTSASVNTSNFVSGRHTHTHTPETTPSNSVS